MRPLRSVLYLLSCILPASAGILQSSGSFSIDGSPQCSDTQNSNLLASASCSGAFTSGAFQAQSDYGVLKASATFTAANETAQTVAVLTTAYFQDFLNLSSTGAPATIDFVFNLTGSLSGTGATVSLSLSGAGGTPVNATAPGIYTFSRPWATFIPLTGSLQAWAQFDNGGPGPWSGTATSNFFSTATLTGISVFDGSHVDITDTVNITGGAGSYPLSSSGVPEPSTFLLTGGAAVAVFGRKIAGLKPRAE
jgi:hypothetical protein